VKRSALVLVNRAVNAVVRKLHLSRFRGGELLFLTTTGRKSGEPRTVPLLYVRDGDDHVVAASNGGSDWEPAWWLNMQANPHGTVEVRRQRHDVTATEVVGDEREAMWARLSSQLDTYDGYQRKVRRRIAVVRLTPVDA
jgi:deazaflavin-dependent oxidoreductase (nitroreductase family)